MAKGRGLEGANQNTKNAIKVVQAHSEAILIFHYFIVVNTIMDTVHASPPAAASVPVPSASIPSQPSLPNPFLTSNSAAPASVLSSSNSVPAKEDARAIAKPVHAATNNTRDGRLQIVNEQQEFTCVSHRLY